MWIQVQASGYMCKRWLLGWEFLSKTVALSHMSGFLKKGCTLWIYLAPGSLIKSQEGKAKDLAWGQTYCLFLSGHSLFFFGYILLQNKLIPCVYKKEKFWVFFMVEKQNPSK